MKKIAVFLLLIIPAIGIHAQNINGTDSTKKFNISVKKDTGRYTSVLNLIASDPRVKSLEVKGNQITSFNISTKPDSAIKRGQQAYKLALKLKDTNQLVIATRSLGDIYATTNKNGIAVKYFRSSLSYSKHKNDNRSTSETAFKMAKLFERSGRLDSALYYQQIALAAKDSLISQEKAKHALQLSYTKRERYKDMLMEAQADEAAIRLYAMFVVVGFFLVLAMVFWRNNRKNKKAKKLLQQQKEQIETTLKELKITQNQLVQTAKMASLGELTAGIAHEIQNPLNFVNNFSEVSVELIKELMEEAETGRIADVICIANDLNQNLEKINYHGKRADSIVKGMLEHSRTGSGERGPANINTITDEFFKLAYHGMRAKDRSFNVEMVEHFDKTLPEINIMQQDIGRVLANIFNNAFYAVHDKQKNAGDTYKPMVTVTTLLQKEQVAVKIKDNGNGIPDNIKDKIMQPFFTTKPPGEGTGLGLSLSYDIVVKGHGGSINIDTNPGEFTEFVVSLPL